MSTPITVLVELDLDGAWTDITGYCRIDAGLAIKRGRSDEQGSASPAALSLSVNNADGRFSPKNPTGPYYGLIGRNTPIRVTVLALGAGDDSIRFTGEVASWPVFWELSQHDVWVAISAAGIRRRLSQGQTPLRAPLFRASVAAPGLLGYWPMHDPVGSGNFESAAPSGAPLTIGGSVTFVANDTAFPAVPALPTFNGASAQAALPASSSGTIQVRALVYVPSLLAILGETLFSVSYSGGDVGLAELGFIANTAEFILSLFNHAGAFIAGATTPLADLATDAPYRISMLVDQNGTGVDLRFDAVAADGTVITRTDNATSLTLGTPVLVSIGATSPAIPSRFPFTGVSIGELIVQDQATATSDLQGGLTAYAGELAQDRITRLCNEEDIPIYAGGPTLGGGGVALGPQLTGTLLQLLDEAAKSDGGVLTEPLEALGLVYTVGSDLYNQVPVVTVDYAGKDLAGLEVQPDDYAVVNDLTVNRIGGTGSRYELTTGPLSVQAPPDGVGRYDSEIPLSLAADSQTADQASWRVHLGTVDEPRYPGTAFDLLRATDPFTAGEIDDVLLLMREGAAMRIGDPPTFAGAPDDIRQLVAGWQERISSHTYQFLVSGIPASPYDVGVYDDEGDGTYLGLTEEPGSRYSSSGTTTNEAVDTTETAIDISTPSGPKWTNDAGEYPFDIWLGGERITVGGCTGTGASQTFTGCTRSVNGVVKSHANGAELRLWQPAVYAL